MPPTVEDIWRSDRLIYRSIREDDQEWWFKNIDGDPNNICLSTPLILAPPRKAKTEDFMKLWTTPDSLLDCIVCLRQPKNTGKGDDTEAPETRIGFVRLAHGGYGTSPHSRAGNFGIVLAAPYQNKGYGTEATNWILDWAFRHGNMHSVNLGTIDYNKRAHRCYEKCGFKLGGRRRQCFWHDRKYWDLLFYDILEEEWKELRGYQ
ncbi:acyl-CoA N-acyltransferase [Cryphonectria parasitica EP155]|uniref:Acyl-CoA N-acyltransferase n=1 Tax=Cryphonectria parasitica (strain ATCC 38755 / EP155) TaxID=660469 RepID=A0A9P4XXP6_CRYP1|nr:acyl-CoA N-acyltransferase [Cryphonectria parasitica EP155]KAF3762826.1 acyl-CoA N-acyltransferase [Cryphonectria parasitica EP155]